MVSDKKLTEKSKKLSWLLRHGAAEAGLNVDPAGWVPTQQVLNYLKISKDDLHYAVEYNNKNRLQITDTHIRACQGHSTEIMPITLDALEESWDIFTGNDTLWHGTNLDAIYKIAKEGLLPIKRTHVHLAPFQNSLVGKRNNTSILLTISTMMLRNEGIKIFQAHNGVILVRHVPNTCIIQAYAITRPAKKKQSEIDRMFPGN